MEIAPNPEKLDFETNINSINRTTSTMIFAGVTYIQPRGKEIYKLLHKAMSLDWTDATHTLTATYVPSGNGVTEHTELSILVQLAEETSVDVKVSLAHLHQKYIRYMPIGWEITVINAGQLIDDFHATWGITAAMLRQLIIQREIANNIAKDKAKNCLYLGVYDFTKKNMTRSSEEIHVKWGVRHLIDDIYRAYDPSYPGPQLVIQL